MLLYVLQTLLFLVLISGAVVLGLIVGMIIGPIYLGLSAARYFVWLIPGDNSDSSFDHI